MISMRPATEDDFPSIWRIFQEIIAAGDTYTQDETFSEHEARQLWLGPRVRCFVAEADGQVVGAYKLLPNYPGRGAHVANGSYIVDAGLRGGGIGRLMVEHSLREASNPAIERSSSTSWSAPMSGQSSCTKSSASARWRPSPRRFGTISWATSMHW